MGFSRGFWLGVGLLGGCGPGTATDTTGTEGSGTAGTGGEPTDGVEVDESALVGTQRGVDLLFVVDNSGSMATPQARLSQAIGSLLAVLDADDVRANYRIAVTTTDSGNPRCPAASSTPEGGRLVLSSCLDRVDAGEFTFNDEDFSASCTDFCGKRDADLQVLATTTELDPQAQPRRWVERSEGVLNVKGAPAEELLRCYLPQGVAGCGFESHLESMYLALAKAADRKSGENYGFMRDAAQLAIVIVSDETDCSVSPGGKEIFTSNKVFWNDPELDVAPTSAVCWRAGVACSGGNGVYSECHAENHDLQGASGAADSQAVLQPVAKYVDLVKGIEAAKREIDELQRVKVWLLTGVPAGYASFDAELMYADSPDPDYQASFGIGPGCVFEDPKLGTHGAAPPVRERAFAEAFTEPATRRLYSLCDADYAGALAAIGEEIAAAIGPVCMPRCVRDVDPPTPVLDPNCRLFERDLIADMEQEVPACDLVNGAWQTPMGASVCFGAKVDPNGTQTPLQVDDMSPACVDEGFNLEFEIVRTGGPTAWTTIVAKCELSPDPAADCPKL